MRFQVPTQVVVTDKPITAWCVVPGKNEPGGGAEVRIFNGDKVREVERNPATGGTVCLLACDPRAVRWQYVICYQAVQTRAET